MSEWHEVEKPMWGDIHVGDRLTVTNRQETVVFTGTVRAVEKLDFGIYSPFGGLIGTDSGVKSIAFEGLDDDFELSDELFNHIVRLERSNETNTETNKNGRKH